MRFALALLSCLLIIGMLVSDSSAALCSGTQFFEYKFTPISITPAGGKDEKKAGKARCGEGRCDFIVMLYGEERCKTNGHEVKFKGPGNKNSVSRGEFTPESVGYKSHAGWRLSDAKDTPFNVQVCDEDGFPRGRNDAIMNINYNSLSKGCERVKHQDSENPEYPYIFEFEMCCRPISKGQDSGSSGDQFYDARNKFESATGRYNLRSKTKNKPSTSNRWF